MAVSYGSDIVRDTAVGGTTHTLSAFSAAAGSSRVVVIVISTNDYVYPDTVEWGGSTLANGKIESAVSYTTSGDYGTVYILYVKEANLANGSDIVVTFGVTVTPHLAAFTLTGVAQADPLGNTATDVGYGAGQISAGLTASADSLTVSVVAQTKGSIADTTNSVGWTEIYDYSRGDKFGSIAYNTSSGAITNTPSWDATAEFGRIALAEFLAGDLLTKKLKLLTAGAAASATGVEGWVLNAAGDTLIGKFTGATFEASLEGSEAVLKVPTASISPSGATLTTSDTPLVVVRNATYGTSMIDATVIEE